MGIDITEDTENQLNLDRDQSKVFLGNNRYESITYTNSTGVDVVFVEGTLVGRIAATQLLLPLASGAADGSQFPKGVSAQNKTVADGATVELSVCVEGDVAEGKVVFQGADDMDTVVSLKSLRDRIASDTVGINLVDAVSMTEFDN